MVKKFEFWRAYLRRTKPCATGGGFFGAVPPKREICPSKRRLCPIKSNRLSATGVHFGALDSQNTGHQPNIREQEPFFRIFYNEDLIFGWVFTPQFAYFAMKSFFFGFYLRVRGIRTISRIFRDEDPFLCRRFRIRGKKVFVPPPNIAYTPPKSHYSDAGPEKNPQCGTPSFCNVSRISYPYRF